MWSYEMESHGMEYPFCILSDSLKWTLHYGLAGGHLFKKKLHFQTIFSFFFLKNIEIFHQNGRTVYFSRI